VITRLERGWQRDSDATADAKFIISSARRHRHNNICRQLHLFLAELFLGRAAILMIFPRAPVSFASHGARLFVLLCL